MSFEILEERVNPLMGRKEAKLLFHHEGEGTPARVSVRKLAAEHFKAPIDRVFVRSIATKTGGSSALCFLEVYDDNATAERVVPPFLKNRNLPKDQRVSKSKKPEEARPAPPAKPAAAEKPVASSKSTAAQKPTEAKASTGKPESSPGRESKTAPSQEGKSKG